MYGSPTGAKQWLPKRPRSTVRARPGYQGEAQGFPVGPGPEYPKVLDPRSPRTLEVGSPWGLGSWMPPGLSDLGPPRAQDLGPLTRQSHGPLTPFTAKALMALGQRCDPGPNGSWGPPGPQGPGDAQAAPRSRLGPRMAWQGGEAILSLLPAVCRLPQRQKLCGVPT